MTEIAETEIAETPTDDMREVELTAEQINKNFSASGAIVEQVNGIIDGSQFFTDTQVEKNKTIDRGMKYLQIQALNKWYIDDSESRDSPSNKASFEAVITAGKTYLANNDHTYEDYE
jgi:hypothetical protein